MQQFTAGTVDAVVQSDDKPYISPAVHLRTFLEEATASDEGLRDFFRDASTKKRRAAALAKEAHGNPQPSTSVSSEGASRADVKQEQLELQINSRDLGLTALLSHKQGLEMPDIEQYPQFNTTDMQAAGAHEEMAAPSQPNAEQPSAPLEEQTMDARARFKLFLEEHKHSGELADEVVQQVDSTTEFLYMNFPITEFEHAYPPEGSKLQTHKMLQMLHECETTSTKNHFLARGKYFKFRDQELKRSYPTPGAQPVKDVLLTVHILGGMNRQPETHEMISLRKRCEVKLLVRGDMPLVKLREKIFCSADFWCNLEDFEDASNPQSYFLHQFPSNFIFIHDTFYLDLRHPNAIDITEPIRQFINRKKEFGPYHVRDITTARIIDLTVRLGQPYVFQHQGNCEHMIIFSDLRTLNASDEQKLKEYPIRLYENVPTILCCACRETVAAMVITESDRMPTTPSFMCYACFRAFHYERKRRVGNFRAFHYIDRSGVE